MNIEETNDRLTVKAGHCSDGSRYWSSAQSLNFNWRKVFSGYWSRYPNPNSGHVFSEDFLEVRVLESGKLYAKRLIMKTNKLPSWGQHFFNARQVAVIEEVIVDRDNRTLTTYTRNIGLRRFMGTTEKTTYFTEESHAKAERTEVAKECWIESDTYGFRSAIKEFGINRYKKNCVKATEGFVSVLERLFNPKKGHNSSVVSSGSSSDSGNSKSKCSQLSNSNNSQQSTPTQAFIFTTLSCCILCAFCISRNFE